MPLEFFEMDSESFFNGYPTTDNRSVVGCLLNLITDVSLSFSFNHFSEQSLRLFASSLSVHVATASRLRH